MAALVTNSGKAICANRIIGSGTQPNYGSWGTGAGTTGATDTTLFTESMSTENDGDQNRRVTATTSRVTTTVTNDTYQAVYTLTADSGKTITNTGLFDSDGLAADLSTAPSGGNLFAKADHTGIPLSAADSIQYTVKVKFS